MPDLAPDEPRWKVYACLGLLLAGLYLVVGPRIRLSRWSVHPKTNMALTEALQWRRGRLALPADYRTYETARAGDHVYNVVGLSFVLISVVGTMLSAWAGALPGTFYTPYYVACIALALPLLAFWAFKTRVKSSAWAAVLAAYVVAGTCLTPILQICRSGGVYYINHVLAVDGLLIFTAALLGRRPAWLAAIGLCLAVWSRQMTCLYALPFLWIAWRHGRRQGGDEAPRPHPDNNASRRPRLGRPWVIAAAAVVVIAAVPMTLNTLKFGNPFDTGYQRLYEGRTDPIARRAQMCFYGPRYIPVHARAMNINFPRMDIRGGSLYLDCSDTNGASIWLTCPLLFAVFVTCRRWWSDRPARVLMLGTLPVILGLMGYHTTGANQAGYYRYALDFIPIWLVVVAPYICEGRWKWITPACLAYSALYFRLVP